MNKILIIGAGELGTALNFVLAKNKENQITLWDRDQDKIPNCPDFDQAILANQIVFLAIPTLAVSEVVIKIKKQTQKPIIVLLSKGLTKKGLTAFESAQEVYPKNKLVIISGPMIAEELITNKSGLGLIAGAESLAVSLAFNQTLIELTQTQDLIGLSWIGVLKNVYAVRLGMAQAKNWGKNYLGNLVTKALQEMVSFLGLVGGNPETVFSVAGVGDLIATGFSQDSSNFQAGVGLANKQKPIPAEGINALSGFKKRFSEKVANWPELKLLMEKVFAN